MKGYIYNHIITVIQLLLTGAVPNIEGRAWDLGFRAFAGSGRRNPPVYWGYKKQHLKTTLNPKS